MIINGLEFPFSALNADDLDRLETAQEHMKQADAIERHRAKTGLADAIRGQCRLVMGFLDELLGEGASARLGLTGSDFKACQQVVSEIHDRIAEEQAELQAQPTNREQRRAAAKAQQRTRTAGRIVNNQPVSFPQPAAARMVERVDKARHGNPADAALKLADARVAVDALKDDPVAMQQLADYALKIAAERHV
jgi:hypothetical protein